MKKLYFFAILIYVFLPSCTQEIIVDETETAAQTEESQTLVFNARILESKTHLGQKTGSVYPNYWSEGDMISVNGVASAPIEAGSPDAGTSHATFTIQGVISTPYYCAYPASALSGYSACHATLTLPATQSCQSGTYDPSAFIMIGGGSGSNLTFSPVMSAIKLTVPGSYGARISWVMFETLGTEKVSGPFNTDFSGISAASGASSRVMAYASGEGAAFGSSIFLLIPAQTYSSGMRFTIRATDGTQMVFSTSSSFAAQAGMVYTLSSRNYSPDAEVIPDGLMVMSSNVRYATARDKASDPDTGDRDWTNRKAAYCAMINNYRPAVIGLQEAQKEQVKDIKSGCSGYNHYGLGRDRGFNITSDGNIWGSNNTYAKEESSTILYRTDLITLNSSGTVWHSNNPTSVGTYFPEMEDKVCQTSTWAILTYKPTNKQFFLLNTHPSVYNAAHSKEVTLIRNTIASKNTGNLPVILTGDWNMEEDDANMVPIENNYYSARVHAQKTDYYETYHWWGTRARQIDHIFYDRISDVYLFRTDKRQWNNLYISDHYPVYAVFDLSSTSTSVPTANFDLPSEPELGETLTFTDHSSSPAGIAYWDWNIGGIRSNAQNPQVVIQAPMDRAPVTLTVVDNNGKIATATKLISVQKYCGTGSHEDYSSSDMF